MTAYLFPGLLGLLTGLILRWTGLARPEGLRAALALRRGGMTGAVPLRSALAALGYAIAGTALLIWLAVIDTDALIAIPLTWGTLLGGLLLGVCAGLCGFTPTTAFAALGAGHAPEALCALLGCTLAAAFLPQGEALPGAAGDLLAQGCLGALLAVIALCIPNPRAGQAAEAPEAAPLPPETAEAPDPESAPEKITLSSETAEAPDPESAPEETFVALLEGEEPLVVDTVDVPAEEPDGDAAPAAAETEPDE